MSEGLKTTFRLLAKTRNEAALRALILGLDSRHSLIREGALRAILLRRNPTGHRVVLGRLHALDGPSREIVRTSCSRMAGALRSAILGNDEDLRLNGCRAAVWFREYDLIPALISAAEDQGDPAAELAGKTLLEVGKLLYEELAGLAEQGGRQDRQIIRGHVVTALEQSAERFEQHKRREIIETLALLASRNSSTLREILWSSRHPAFVVLLDVLSGSPSEGVIRLLLSFLDDERTPSAVISVVAKRCDEEFIRRFLRKIGREPSAAVKRNLRRMDSIGWLQNAGALSDQLDDAAQRSVVKLSMLSGIPRMQTFNIIEHFLIQGKPGGRRAASEALGEFAGSEANALALEALEDDDPHVQANVLDQLRRRRIPGALPRLVEMVDSPHAVVRKAARQNLGEFSFKRFLGAFDMLDEGVRHSTGSLVKKIDPQTVPLLRAEMESQMRTRRLRALEIAQTIGVVAQLEDTIIKLLRDEDHIVRVDAATALEQCETPASLRGLREALDDGNPMVREAARRSLEERAVFMQWRETLYDPRD